MAKLGTKNDFKDIIDEIANRKAVYKDGVTTNVNPYQPATTLGGKDDFALSLTNIPAAKDTNVPNLSTFNNLQPATFIKYPNNRSTVQKGEKADSLVDDILNTATAYANTYYDDYNEPETAFNYVIPPAFNLSKGKPDSREPLASHRKAVSYDGNVVLNGNSQNESNPNNQTLPSFSTTYQQYNPSYQDQIDKLLNDIINADKFSYDAANDDLFKYYAKEYQKAGDLAARDSMGRAMAASGGFGNTYAQTVAQQVQNGYNSQLTDMIPEFEQNAYNRYVDELSRQQNNLGLLMDAEKNDYNRYLDALSQQNYLNELAYEREQDALAQQNYLNEIEYQKSQDALAQQNYLDKLALSENTDVVNESILSGNPLIDATTYQQKMADFIDGTEDIIAEFDKLESKDQQGALLLQMIQNNTISEEMAELIANKYGL